MMQEKLRGFNIRVIMRHSRPYGFFSIIANFLLKVKLFAEKFSRFVRHRRSARDRPAKIRSRNFADAVLFAENCMIRIIYG